MCGIIGYVGTRNISDVLLTGLSRLEYRGYDSAGLASVDHNGLSVVREAGKLERLRSLVVKSPISGHIGIGHTRWATHGEPSVQNAHPQADCRGVVAVVHNGIIENHEALRAELLKEGHKFNSKTDTEVLAHLIESYQLKGESSLEQAVRSAIERLRGSYAFCAISEEHQDYFVAARNGSPLVVGLGDGENFVASDAPAILDYTNKVIFLEDYQIVVVSKEDVRVTTTKGEHASYEVNTLDWHVDQAEKNGYSHFMLKEIEEQPEVLRRIVNTRVSNEGEFHLFDHLKFNPNEFKQVSKLIVQACGTSWHAALASKYFFEDISGIPTEVDVSSEFRYRRLVPQQNALVLSITQSGETIDTLMGLRRAKQCGFRTLSLCNVLGSTITRESDGVTYTQAGPEIGVASTKAFTAQLAHLFLLSLYFGVLRGNLSETERDRYLSELRTIPEKMQAIVDKRDEIHDIALKYFNSRDFLFLGRGVNYPNAHEGALKIKEVAYLHATGHPAGEMKHGPIALIDDKMPVVALAPQSTTYEKMISNIEEVKARSGKVIAIATEGDSSIVSHVDDVFFVPQCEELLSPLLTVLPLQYLAFDVGVLRGTDVDQPRNLAKSVTVE